MNIDIKHIAKLSRLRIEDSELEKFEKEMQNIVDIHTSGGRGAAVQRTTQVAHS